MHAVISSRLIARRRAFVVAIVAVLLIAPLAARSEATLEPPTVLRYGDAATGAYVIVDATEGGVNQGAFAFSVPGVGLFWPSEPADVIPDGDGLTVGFSGPGWHDPNAEIRAPLADYVLSGARLPVQLSLNGTIAADLATASFSLTYDGNAVSLISGPPAVSPAITFDLLVNDLAAADLAAIYGMATQRLRGAVSEQEFVETVADGLSDFGTIVDATLLEPPEIVTGDSGWYLAVAPVAVSFDKTGVVATYTSHMVTLFESGEWRFYTLDQIEPDLTTPLVTERVSESSQRGQGNGLSHEAYISADGSYVTFESGASDLVSGDTNAVADVFVHDRVSDTTTRVSVATDGTQGNGSSEDPTISPDGRYVAYRSAASNLVAGDTNNKYDIFVHDRQTGTTSRVSLASDGTQANGSSDSAVVARDGTAVVFRSFGRLVAGDTNGESDIYVRDLVTGTTTRVSVASDGTQGNGGTDGPTISDDGRYVAFDSVSSNLVAGDTNAVRDVFLHDRTTGTTSRVSLASDGTQANAQSWEATLDADGGTVAFTSSATNLVAGDTNAKDDVFVVTLSSGAIVRASVADDESQSTNHADETSLSADGTLLAFYSTASNLVAGDTNGKGDVFVRDLVNGTTTRWSLTTDGLEGNDRSANPTIAGDGRTVAFHSFATNLVPNDTNAVADVFVRGPDQ